MNGFEVTILSFVLAVSFGLIVYAFRELRRVRILSYEVEKDLREQIKDRDDRIERMNRLMARSLREWWMASSHGKVAPKNPPPSLMNDQPMQPVRRNGILPPV